MPPARASGGHQPSQEQRPACDAPDRTTARATATLCASTRSTELLSWFASDPTGTGETDLLILGDLELLCHGRPHHRPGKRRLHQPGREPSTVKKPTLTSSMASGATSTMPRLAITRRAGHRRADYHINADEPSVLDYNTDFKTAGLTSLILYAPDRFRISDHDPVMVGLNPA